ncbi:MAG: RpiB/LacA/LacB family sugar-phosphate isomerase [Christensenellales bacterium]|jgi:ribose 5-phosphate isomerase B
MKIAIGNDQHGLEFKNLIVNTFPEHEFVDVGTNDTSPANYPDYAKEVATLVASGECDRGILCCGTGIGMAIAANKVKGCYAAVCHDVYSTERSILSNNSNVLCMGALVIGKKTCETLVKLWLSLEFDEKSASAQKVALIKAMEE